MTEPQRADGRPPNTSGSPELAAVLATLARIERRLDELDRTAALMAPLAGLLDTAPAAVAAFTDTMDSIADRVASSGVSVDERLRSVLRVLDVSTTPRALDGLSAVLASKLLDPSSLAVVSQLANALAAPDRPEPVGMWGALRALSDPNTQRAVGFLLGVARAFGKNLDSGEVDACRDRLLAAPAATKEPR